MDEQREAGLVVGRVIKVKVNRKKQNEKPIWAEKYNPSLGEFANMFGDAIPIKINGEEYKVEKRLGDVRILLVKADHSFGYAPGNPMYDYMEKYYENLGESVKNIICDWKESEHNDRT